MASYGSATTTHLWQCILVACHGRAIAKCRGMWHVVWHGMVMDIDMACAMAAAMDLHGSVIAIP